MIYVTVKLPQMFHQMTFEDFLFKADDCNFQSFIRNFNQTSTRTYQVERLSKTFTDRVNVQFLIAKLRNFNQVYADLEATPNKQELYRQFCIPKKSGGLRQINAPNEQLMSALRNLKGILESDFGALYHTNAFAYIKGRSTLDAVKRHQQNDSQWYGKYDLHDFFGSTTLEFVIHMLERIFPFNLVLQNPEGREELVKALNLAFLNGGLPQGTPISPTITNIMMIPVDYKLSQILRQYQKQKFIYTRYADDFIISSQYDFNFREIEKLIVETLAAFGAPFTINSKKTRYGSRSGRNWNLGVMIGQQNQITVGYKKKKTFQTMLFNYAMDSKNGIHWPKEDVQHMEGLRSYYRMVEGIAIDNIIVHVSGKTNVDIMSLIKSDLGR